jgi:catechol 2,3-dioxygenase-like lactoylglutathione lyase family enzyme
MKIKLCSVPVADQKKALKFYSEELGFVKKTEIPMGDVSWLTVVSAEEPDGPELVLESNANYPAMKALKEAYVRDGIPFTAFQVNDIQTEYQRLKELGVKFNQKPTKAGLVTQSVFEDTCRNLIQIYQV